jgi:diguanylate cyclase (GGDEF)-like protein
MTAEHITTQPILDKEEHKHSLTGYPNRRWLKEHFDTVVEENENKLGLLFIDLDGLKDVNDTDGYGEGNNYIFNALEAIRDTIRHNPNDFIIHGEKGDGLPKVVHQSGDEFIVLLPGVDTEQVARGIAKRVKETLSEIGIPLSVGVAIYSPEDDSLADLLKRAETGMKIDKKKQLFASLSPEQLERIQEIKEEIKDAKLDELGVRALMAVLRGSSE